MSSPIDQMMGIQGEDARCTRFCHWWRVGAKIGDKCLCGIQVKERRINKVRGSSLEAEEWKRKYHLEVSRLNRKISFLSGLALVQNGYIDLLGLEISGLTSIASIHGWVSPYIDQGKEFREKIKRFKCAAGIE